MLGPMKHRMSWILGLGLFVGACGDDGATAEGGSGSSSGTDGTTMPNTTMPNTTMPNTTEGMTSTSSTTADDTTSTGMVDSSGSGSSGSGSGESSSSGDPPGDPAYPPCMPDADPVCPEPYDHCYGSLAGSGLSVCSLMCMEAGDCPAPETGNAVAVCAGPMFDECLLDCADDATCPDGMECVDVAGIGMFFRCAWPDA
jgi:hypothetical protein